MNIIQPDTTVRIDAPDAPGIHGKIGTVHSWNPKTARYAVAMPAYRGALSYVEPHELIVITVPDTHNEEMPPLPKIGNPKPFSPATVAFVFGPDPEDISKFAFELLQLAGHELDHQDGGVMVYDLEEAD